MVKAGLSRAASMPRGGRVAFSTLKCADEFIDLTGPQDFAAQGHNPGRLGRTLGGFGQGLPERVVVAALLAMALRPEHKARGRIEVRHHSSSFPAGWHGTKTRLRQGTERIPSLTA